VSRGLLLVCLLVGALLGAGLAVLSVIQPGLLPVIDITS